MIKKRQVEILYLIAEELTKNGHNGICSVIDKLINSKQITVREYLETNRFILDNKPTPQNQYKEFTENEYWLGNVYWWKTIKLFPLTRRIRISYINKLIDTIK